MAESLIQVTEGSGKKIHTWQRTIGASNVEDDFSLPGEYPLATYTVAVGGVSAGTINDHLLEIMAGAALNVRIRRIRVQQAALGGAASSLTVAVYRLSTAGTGGTVATPAKLDTGDAASGATAMTLPTVKGTETTLVLQRRFPIVAAQPTNANPADYLYEQLPNHKPLIIPAGVANGIAIKTLVAGGTATWDLVVDLVETSFL